MGSTCFYSALAFHGMQVVISQMNGQDHPSHSVHVFNVGKMRLKLCRGWITKAREIYSASMQVLVLPMRDYCKMT
jgi:hypothetical protein